MKRFECSTEQSRHRHNLRQEMYNRMHEEQLASRLPSGLKPFGLMLRSDREILQRILLANNG